MKKYSVPFGIWKRADIRYECLANEMMSEDIFSPRFEFLNRQINLYSYFLTTYCREYYYSNHKLMLKTHFMIVRGIQDKKEEILCGISKKENSKFPTTEKVEEVTCGNCKTLLIRFGYIKKENSEFNPI